MAATVTGPTSSQIQPDPVITNVMANSATQGGWLADIIAPVKAVVKDYVRMGVRDAQTPLSTLFATFKAPGALPNLANRPSISWLTKLIEEQALRVEITQEDIDNAPSPDQEPMAAAVQIQNGLRATIEALVKDLFDPTAAAFVAGDHTTAAFSPWAGAGTAIEEDIGNADTAMMKNGGIRSNAILIPPALWSKIWSSAEVRAARGWGFTPDEIARAGGLPPTFFGKRLFVPGARTDTTPTGTLTPGFIWNDANIRLFYTPSLNGEVWNGSDPTFAGQFENQRNGTAFEARQKQDADWDMNGLTHVWGNVRRSAPFIVNADLAYVISGAA